MELTELKGIGKKTEELFLKIGVHNVEELLEYYPRDYELFYAPITVSDIGYKNFAAIRGAFTQELFERNTGKLKIMTSTFKDETGMPIKTVWFNSSYLKNTIYPGQLYVIRGKVNRKYGIYEMEQPRVYNPVEYIEKMRQRQPVYPLTKGLSSNMIAKAVKQAFQTECFIHIDDTDKIPEYIKEKYNLCKKSFACKSLHFPADNEAFMKSLYRVSFEEIFQFIYAVKKNGFSSKADSSIIIKKDPRTEKFAESLHFSLTKAQKNVYSEISQDLSSGKVMKRLLQGDVGSGKTIVALFCLMDCAFAGYQGALMAPTEVLAAQHYETITKYFKDNGIKLNAALLTGSMSSLEKKVVYDALKNGRIDIIIGTHALIQDKVSFKNLGLVITDEQHRFGIKQRQTLSDKASEENDAVMPHILAMSATPIPRTLALILYGGMDISVINELPAERKKTKNAVIDESLKENAYRLMQREIARGHQVYIICPLVEFSEEIDARNVTDYTQLLKEVFDGSIRVGMLHGQMPSAKKNEIMQKFADGDIDVLVSTTVVEVGVNVPNATVIMIEDANRFGLATLHQLRGRVGRSQAQSYCILVNASTSKESEKRLSILKKSNDGFEIAAEDLKLRGPGEFMGIRQSGEMGFKTFDIYRDADIAKTALEAVNEILRKNDSIDLPVQQQDIVL